MASLIVNLIDVLKKQSELYDQITQLSTEKKQYLIKNDIGALKEVTAKENVVASKAVRSDKERLDIMHNICIVLNKNKDDMTLTALADIIKNQPEYEDFAAAIKQAAGSVSAMKSINEENKALIESSLEFINYNINAIHSSMDTTPLSPYNDKDDLGASGSFLDING